MARFHATSNGPVPFTPQEEAARDAEEAQALVDSQTRAYAEAQAQAKLTGIEILGVMCSATREDQNGLSAIALGVTLARMNGQTFPDTRFEFENGNLLVITDDNFDQIYSAWVPFRQSFFAAE